MDELADLRSRLDALERGNHHLRLALGIVAFASLITVVGWQSSKPAVQDLIRAHAVEVVSADGKTLVKLGYDSWMPGGSVAVYDKNGERRGWIRGGPYGGNVGIVGPGKESKSLGAILSVWRQRADLSLANMATGNLTYYGIEGETASLTIHDKKGDREMITKQAK